MKQIKIAIFENEFHLINDDFEIANYTFFDEKLDYDVFETASKFGEEMSKIHNYDLAFIDIDLAKAGDLAGLVLIAKLIEVEYPIEKMIILTGHSTIESKLKERGLPKIEILTKPIDVEDLSALIKKALD